MNEISVIKFLNEKYRVQNILLLELYRRPFVKIFNHIFTSFRVCLSNDINNFILQFRNLVELYISPKSSIVKSLGGQSTSPGKLVVHWRNWRINGFWFIWTLYTFKAEFLFKIGQVVDPLSPNCCERHLMDILWSSAMNQNKIFLWTTDMTVYSDWKSTHKMHI